VEFVCKFCGISRDNQFACRESQSSRDWTVADIELMQTAAQSLLTYTHFETFSKKSTQVNTFECHITKALWEMTEDGYTFHIESNRFLRGMIRGLVGTLLQVGRGQISLEKWHEIVLSNNEQLADFSTPAHGLYLSLIEYPPFLKKIV
jgi:tRNA pseudouridine38-40 synthase